MMFLTTDEIRKCIDGEYIKFGDRKSFTNVVVDTRQIVDGSIFFAIKGNKVNGNTFVATAIKSGATLCIIDEVTEPLKDILNDDFSEIGEEVSIIKVEDSVLALGKLAKYYRNKLNVKVLGSTGSVGKTSVKDIAAAMLSSKYEVLKTKGNYNSKIGLPLTIMDLEDRHDVAVIEMGMSNRGEIEYLANIARPDTAIITNIGVSHIENLGSRENILREKLDIATYFNSCDSDSNSSGSSNINEEGRVNRLVINNCDDLLNTVNIINSKSTDVYNDKYNYDVIRVGTSSNSDIYADNIELMATSSSFNINIGGRKISYVLNMPGKHNIINFLLALAAVMEFGVSVEEAIDGMKSMEKTSMRLDMITQNGYTIVNDCYNASPDSMRAAIDVVRSFKGSRHIGVLGDMNELGELAVECHKAIAEYARDNSIDYVFTTGVYREEYRKVFGDRCIVCKTKQELSDKLKNFLSTGDVVLIKASRGAKFEEVFTSIAKQ